MKQNERYKVIFKFCFCTPFYVLVLNILKDSNDSLGIIIFSVFFEAYIVAGVIEESMKLWFISYYKKFCDAHVDGIVLHAVGIALGLSTLENIGYATVYAHQISFFGILIAVKNNL